MGMSTHLEKLVLHHENYWSAACNVQISLNAYMKLEKLHFEATLDCHVIFYKNLSWNLRFLKGSLSDESIGIK